MAEIYMFNWHSIRRKISRYFLVGLAGLAAYGTIVVSNRVRAATSLAISQHRLDSDFSKMIEMTETEPGSGLREFDKLTKDNSFNELAVREKREELVKKTKEVMGTVLKGAIGLGRYSSAKTKLADYTKESVFSPQEEAIMRDRIEEIHPDRMIKKADETEYNPTIKISLYGVAERELAKIGEKREGLTAKIIGAELDRLAEGYNTGNPADSTFALRTTANNIAERKTTIPKEKIAGFINDATNFVARASAQTYGAMPEYLEGLEYFNRLSGLNNHDYITNSARSLVDVALENLMGTNCVAFCSADFFQKSIEFSKKYNPEKLPQLLRAQISAYDTFCQTSGITNETAGLLLESISENSENLSAESRRNVQLELGDKYLQRIKDKNSEPTKENKGDFWMARGFYSTAGLPTNDPRIVELNTLHAEIFK